MFLANGKVAINSTGNVGIGTSTPVALLDVSGSARISNGLILTGSISAKTTTSFIIEGSTVLNLYSDSWRFSTGITLKDSNTGNTFLGFGSGTVSSNASTSFVRIFNSTTGSATGPRITADSNVALHSHLTIQPQGTGSLFISSSQTIISGSLTVTGGITGSLLGTATGALTASYVMPLNQNLIVTGSVRGQVSALSIVSNTASINLETNNFFTVTLEDAANTHISVSNIQPGQTANIRITQGSAGTGTVSFNSAIKSGSLYTGSAVANAVDIATFISFDSSTLYMSAVTNLK